MKANNIVVFAIVAAAGCAGVSQPGGTGGGGGGDDGSGAGSGSGSSTPPANTLSGSVLDERNDTIDFSSGQPVHTHGGAPIALSEGSCADVYKYAYLMSATPPMYGRENAPNPLAWTITRDATSSTDASYRVRDEADQVLLDWTATTSDAHGRYEIALYRDGAHGIAALGASEGTMHLDVRFHDAHGNEVIESGCWVNHPLAAPLLVTRDAVATDLDAMSLPADSAISQLLAAPTVTVAVYEITQQTAEPIKLELKAPIPTGTVSTTAVDTWVNIGSTPPLDDCTTGTACDKAVVTRTATPATAPLSGAWSIVAQSGTDDSIACAAAGLDVTCNLPARAANEAPRFYRVRVMLGGVAALKVGGPLDTTSEWTAGAYGMYTGNAPGAIQYNCDLFGVHNNIKFCKAASQYQHIVALDRATIAFDKISMSLLTYGGSTGVAPSYLPADALALPARTWDAGDKGL